MKKMIKLGLISAVTAAMLVGCGSSSSSKKKPTEGGGGAGKATKTLKYLSAMGEAFNADMQGLVNAWKPNGIAYLRATNGSTGGWLPSESAAAMIAGCAGIADEVGAEKMQAPQNDGTTEVESQFSWNSTADFFNNIYSIHKVWRGAMVPPPRLTNETGLRHLLAMAGANAADLKAVDNAIAMALQSVANISDISHQGSTPPGMDILQVVSGTYAIPKDQAFRTHIANKNFGEIKAAQAKILDLQEKLEALSVVITDNASKLDNNPAAATIVKSVANNVVVNTYTKMGQGATALNNALSAMKDGATAAEVATARNAWRNVRAPWEASEAYIVEMSGGDDSVGGATDGNVDVWPVLPNTELDANLASWDGNPAAIINGPGISKGFHTIEYMLFGQGTAVESVEAAAARLNK